MMEECSWFSICGNAFGEMWDASFKNGHFCIGKTPSISLTTGS